MNIDESKNRLAVEATNCLDEVDNHENIMDCLCCLYFLDKHNKRIIEEKVNQIHLIPEELTIISIPIIPSKMTKTSYSLYGIETIANGFLFEIYNLIGKNYYNKVFFKVFYKHDPLYTIPVIVLEIILLEKISDETLGLLTETYKKQFSQLTGSIPSFELVLLYDDPKKLKRVLDIPLLLGVEDFRRESKFSKSGFTNKQIQEMNYIHSIPIQSIYLSEFVDDRRSIYFKDTRDSIQKENEKTHDEVSEAIKKIFENDPILDNDGNDLPF